MRGALWIWIAIGVGIGIGAVVLRLAWVGDDAYITLRTVENLANGHGPVWNLGERVQTYTHPLWMLLLTLVRLLTGECYFGTIGLSLLLALGAVALLMRAAGSWPAAAAVAALLLWSRSFTEYAVCGLENPLTFVLLAGLAVVIGDTRAAPERRTIRIAWLFGLLAMTRVDLAVIGAPLLFLQMPAIGWRGWWWRAAIGLTPLLLWAAFATVYYGTPLPITAYAKAMSHGLPASVILEQGLQHVVFMLLYDPLTLAVIGAGIAVGLAAPGSRGLAVAAVLYCGYIVSVGGDFMAGRFFTVPFVLAVAILGRALGSSRTRWSVVTALAAAVFGLAFGLPAWFHAPGEEREPTWHYRGILDERSAYFRQLGLFSPQRRVPIANAGTETLRMLGWSGPVVASAGKAGVYAFEGGEQLHFFDPMLCDALLARLPASATGDWRIGHIPRDVPAGYLESLAFGGNRIVDPELRRYFGGLQAMIRAPLFEPARWQALWALWTGGLEADLVRYRDGGYRAPPRVALAADDVAISLTPQIPGIGPLWFTDERARLVPRGGLEVRLAAPVAVDRLDAQLNGGFRYRIRGRLDGQKVCDVETDLTAVSQLVGMVERAIDLPDRPRLDVIWIDTVDPAPHLVAAIGKFVPQ